MVFNLCLDIGTTNIRCAICDTANRNEIINIVYDKLNILYLDKGCVEINPDQLWNQILELIKNCIDSSSFSIDKIEAIGISAQRNTFVTWNRTNGKEFHNLVVWNDLRANEIVESYNKSWMLWGLNTGCKMLYYVTREKRFLAGSVLKFMNAQVLPRLVWVLRNHKVVQDHLAEDNVLYGTLDTWLIYKLTCGTHHVTDRSHASVSVLYDPFTSAWADWAFAMFRIPTAILPRILNTVRDDRDTADGFGVVHKSLLGREIPIACSMADQSASLYGLGCLNEGDIKLTLSTGSFMDVNTGCTPHPSIAGLYPLVSWSLPSSTDCVYLVEGASYDTGTVIDWGRTIGLYKNVEDTSDLASSVESSGGVVFCPGFRGLQAPINDPNATAGFLGVSPHTKREHLVRALLESVAFRAKQLHETVLSETGLSFTSIKVDGGASRNDFLCQLIADLTRLTVLRYEQRETSIMGVANIMSDHTRSDKNVSDELHFSNSREKISRESGDCREFTPHWEGYERCLPAYETWTAALSRFQHWS